jgi:hypothetical protein
LIDPSDETARQSRPPLLAAERIDREMHVRPTACATTTHSSPNRLPPP